MGKNKKKNTDSDLHSVFSVKPIKNSNAAILKCVGHVSGTNEIADEPLMCEKSRNTDTEEKPNGCADVNEDTRYVYKITDTIFARFYHCNIRDAFIMTSKILPVLYSSITYQTELVTGILFTIFIDFVIKSEVKSEKQLINTKLDGNYQLRIKTSENDPPKIIDLDLFEGIDYSIDMIKMIIETDEIKEVIAKILEERRKERQEKMGSVDDFDIPKPRYNFTALVQQYRDNGEIEL